MAASLKLARVKEDSIPRWDRRRFAEQPLSTTMLNQAFAALLKLPNLPQENPIMHHGQVTAEIAQGSLALRKRVEATKTPPSKLDETINIAVWNIRVFGKKMRSSKLRRFSMTWWEGRMSVSDPMLYV